MDSKPAATNDAVEDPPDAATAGNETNNAGEIPFLVTHWLANYVREQHKGSPDDPERKAALARISNATNEIASAFFSLGSYGTTLHPTFGDSFAQQSRLQNASYSDLSRKWSGLPASHLENLAYAVSSSGNTVNAAAHTSLHTNLLQSAGESTEHKDGRTVLDAIEVDETKEDNVMEGSILQKPVLMNANLTPKSSEEEPVRVAEAPADTCTAVGVRSSYADVANKTAETMRKYLDLRGKVQSTNDEIKSLEISIGKQEEKWKALDARFRQLASDPTVDPVRKLEAFDEIKVEKQGCERVSTQLRRKITELTKNHSTRNSELVRLRAEAHSWEVKRKRIVNNFRDPLDEDGHSNAKGSRGGRNYLLQTVLSRQHGLPRSRRRPLPSRSPILDGPKPLQVATTKKVLIGTRLAVTATINSHLSYPVYCLRFDRTGRYFITGADDYLIKVFYLGAGRSCLTKNAVDGSRQLRCNYGANLRGAVLVCSLRGHAGVINDIDVSSDNCFLATASVDGDVRVWGLKDGCPVAILRGHNGGANMVSWSTLTPYRLVTTGSDGFARVWDIRDACLKRYAPLIGKRPEYRLRLTASEKEQQTQSKNSQSEAHVNANASARLLPPLPVRDGSASATSTLVPGSPPTNAGSQAIVSPRAAPQGGIVVPPLPPAVPPLPAAPGAATGGNNAGSNNANQEIAPPGQFTANDLLDEGVKLLKKYKHGSTGEDVTGPGTRSRRAAVNVICVARCPLGGHFTTGSDDGICRIWKEDEDDRVAIVDRRFSQQHQPQSPHPARGVTLADNGKPLLKLMGHISAITDLAYSYAGDRLLSASQKDGVIRIWSIGSSGLLTGKAEERGVTQIVIKLTHPTTSTAASQPVSRRAPGNASRSEASKVSCDVAVWTHDDTYVVSSQSVLVKQSGSEIQPGSQFLFLWDSYTGQCVMGFSGAHTMQCPVVIPHPDDSSLVCTAAADGYSRLWDWETGRCVFTHKNKESTNQDNSNKNKLAGFLDGSWSPDGTRIVLTDDSGCITILDSSYRHNDEDDAGQAWIKDQYFANDYYELFYDRHGYCIERGSEQPPHLAPRGVRCNHSGAPWSDEINEAFGKLIGPLPLVENKCRWWRERIRAKAVATVANKPVMYAGRQNKVRRGVREFDPSSTIMVKASGHVEQTSRKSSSRSSPFGSRSASRMDQTSSPGDPRQAQRALSSNYRYLDYDDMIRRQGDPNDDELLDSEDEEFEPVARNRMNANNSDESDEELEADDMEAVIEADDSPQRVGGSTRRRSEPPARARQQTSRARQQRAQRRARVREDFLEIGSDDEMVVEYMSTNNTPSGPYERDYTRACHFWRAPSSGRIQRKWLRRSESDSSYTGRKIYTPQVGDSVVYIPRAHFESIKDFPSLTPPWQRWPQESVWPVVRCLVRGIRYRFPFEDYFRGGHARCTSIVAILTLEISGIPELSGEREFPWPKPSFVEPSRRHLFELSVFENEFCEYIFPEGLYVGRLQALEAAVRQRGMDFQGLNVHLYYSETLVNQEDIQMKEYNATIESLEEQEHFSDTHLTGSGYGIIRADCESFMDSWSPWEIVIDGSTSQRPSLTEEGKKFILDHLNQQLRKPNVREYFSMPVDEVRYSDYQTMVEVEMNIMFMKRRLDSNYYGSKLSVVSDLRLIRDNCIKYNTMQNDLSEVACQIVEEFEAAVLSSDERALLVTEEEFARFMEEPEHSTGIRQASTEPIAGASRVDSHSTTQTYNLRHRTPRGQSSLESLPHPRPVRQARIRNEPPRRLTRSRGGPPGPQDSLSQAGRARPERGRGNRSEASEDENSPDSTSGVIDSLVEDEDYHASATSAGQSEMETARGNEIPAPSPTRRSARAASRAASANRADESGGDEDSVEAVRQSPRASRRANRNGTAATRSNGGIGQEDSGDFTPSRASRRTTRNGTTTSSNGGAGDGGSVGFAPSRASRRTSRSGAAMTRSRNHVEEDTVESASPRASSRATRTGAGTARPQRTLYPESEEESHQNVDSGSPRASGRATRNRSQRTSYAEESDEDSSQHGGSSDEDSDREVEDTNVSRTRISIRTNRADSSGARRAAVRSSPRSNRAPVARIQQDSSTRRSRRACTKSHQSYEEESEFESADEASVDSEPIESPPKKRSRKQASYVEIPSDYEDEEEFSEDDEEEEEDEPAARQSRPSRKRSNVASSSSNRKKQKRPPSLNLPQLPEWPDIEMNQITLICLAMLKRLAEEDTERLFCAPVLETYPDIADKYLSLVEHPIDMRTIAEERVPEYQSIRELQKDLIQMFDNCVIFNGKRAKLSKYAIDLRARINVLYKEVCGEEDVMLPRRWKP